MMGTESILHQQGAPWPTRRWRGRGHTPARDDGVRGRRGDVTATTGLRGLLGSAGTRGRRLDLGGVLPDRNRWN